MALRYRSEDFCVETPVLLEMGHREGTQREIRVRGAAMESSEVPVLPMRQAEPALLK